jgi:hypothetical protein
MNLKGISYYLSLSCYPVAFLSFFNILYSSYFDHYLNLNSYLITFGLSLFLCVILYFFSKNAEKNINFGEQLILILLNIFFNFSLNLCSLLLKLLSNNIYRFFF